MCVFRELTEMDLAGLSRLSQSPTGPTDALLEPGSLLTICSGCRRLRDQAGTWQTVESYFHHYQGLRFSHGLCPECLRRLYPDLIE
jgi:hypothetical protein